MDADMDDGMVADVDGFITDSAIGMMAPMLVCVS